MSTDDLRSTISAAKDEIEASQTGRRRTSSDTKRSSKTPSGKKSGFSALYLSLGLGIAFVTYELGSHHQTHSGVSSDLNQMLQDARVEVLEYYRLNGEMPKTIQNPALRPYVTYNFRPDGSFSLVAKLGDKKEIMIID